MIAHIRRFVLSCLALGMVLVPSTNSFAGGEFDEPLNEVWIRGYSDMLYATFAPGSRNIDLCLSGSEGSIAMKGLPAGSDLVPDLTHLRMTASGGVQPFVLCTTIRFDASQIEPVPPGDDKPAHITNWEAAVSVCKTHEKTTLTYSIQQLNNEYERKDVGGRRVLGEQEVRFDHSLTCPVPGTKYRFVHKKGWIRIAK